MTQNWTFNEAQQLLELTFIDLLYHAQTVHRSNFDPNQIQLSSLLSIKTGACPEDCKYCPQSGHYNTGLKKEKLMTVEKVVEAAKKAKDNGATRFCMGAAWRTPPTSDFEIILLMVKRVKALGLETCMTLGMLSLEQSVALAEVGLDYYNHNLDTSPEYYGKIISTRTYAERLETLTHVREAGIKLCVGGIVGLGEHREDRIRLLLELANMDKPPESVPINMLIKIAGTPLAEAESVDPFDFIRIVALARIMMPKSYVRLSAGREHMNDQTQALAFMAGANSIFYGDVLLTADNPATLKDQKLFARLGIIMQSDNPFSAYGLGATETPQTTNEKPLFYNAAP